MAVVVVSDSVFNGSSRRYEEEICRGGRWESIQLVQSTAVGSTRMVGRLTVYDVV